MKCGMELLKSRRSVRHYENREVEDEILWKVFELCRYSPTSRNSQGYYFVVIKDRKVLNFLAGLRGQSSAPIARAPVAVAVCSNPEVSKRHVQDGCIAAYHFMLAAWSQGLGTCWIAAMDRDDVKAILNVPREHYVATVTPLGYPSEIPPMPQRKGAKEFVRFLE